MSNKSKFISNSATIVMVTSIIFGSNSSKALTNPFPNLWRKLKDAGSGLTITNPFKPNGSNSSKLTKPSSNGKLSNSSKSFCSKLKSLFTRSSKKSYDINTGGDVDNNTRVHILKGDDNKPDSKSKQKRERLAAAYANDSYSDNLTSSTNSSDNSTNSTDVIQPKSKNKPKSNNPSVSFEELIISSEDSSSSSETKSKSDKNSDLISELLSELEVRKILMSEELDNKYFIEKDIDGSDNANAKRSLYSQLEGSIMQLESLENEIKDIEQLIKSLQN